MAFPRGGGETAVAGPDTLQRSQCRYKKATRSVLPQLQAAHFSPVQSTSLHTRPCSQDCASAEGETHTSSLAISSLGTGTSAQAMLQVYSKHPSDPSAKRAEKE